MDVSRAYKNFRSDPLDWPLQCSRWKGEYFLEVAMPFGARCSSMHMQRVANALVKIIRDRGVNCQMYLDDIIILSSGKEAGQRDFDVVQDLLEELGLPQARAKKSTPGKKGYMAWNCHTWRGYDTVNSVGETLRNN